MLLPERDMAPTVGNALPLRGEDEKGVLVCEDGSDGASGAAATGATARQGEADEPAAPSPAGRTGVGTATGCDWIFLRSRCDSLNESDGVGSIDGRGCGLVAGAGRVVDAASLMMLRRSVLVCADGLQGLAASAGGAAEGEKGRRT